MAKPKTVNIHEAKTHFSKLLKRVERGDEVIIERAGRPIARISAVAPPKLPDRKPGAGKGLFTMTEDFDAPLPAESSVSSTAKNEGAARYSRVSVVERRSSEAVDKGSRHDYAVRR